MPREKSAGAIIFRMEPPPPGAPASQRNGVLHYLLLHYPALNRKGGHWEFAKGHIEEGENYEQTVKREVAEETGLSDIKIIPGFKEHIKYFFRQYKKNIPVGEKNKKQTSWIFKLVTFFLAETREKDVKLSVEHIGFVWLPLDEAIKKTTYKNSKLLLKKANDFLLKSKI